MNVKVDDERSLAFFEIMDNVSWFDWFLIALRSERPTRLVLREYASVRLKRRKGQKAKGGNGVNSASVKVGENIDPIISNVKAGTSKLPIRVQESLLSAYEKLDKGSGNGTGRS